MRVVKTTSSSHSFSFVEFIECTETGAVRFAELCRASMGCAPGPTSWVTVENAIARAANIQRVIRCGAIHRPLQVIARLLTANGWLNFLGASLNVSTAPDRMKLIGGLTNWWLPTNAHGSQVSTGTNVGGENQILIVGATGSSSLVGTSELVNRTHASTEAFACFFGGRPCHGTRITMRPGCAGTTHFEGVDRGVTIRIPTKFCAGLGALPPVAASVLRPLSDNLAELSIDNASQSGLENFRKRLEDGRLISHKHGFHRFGKEVVDTLGDESRHGWFMNVTDRYIQTRHLKVTNERRQTGKSMVLIQNTTQGHSVQFLLFQD
mmetsp:Transcript_19793/g.41212  ORF Transcript_19793/g.41212 Transcript_19793/m.41212 type:complete len:322 (+) Transcript_19793:209-1174(+)